MRPIWSGSIGFGLVNIPVRMYSATDESTLSFTTLDKTNNAKIRYKKVNDVTGKEVKPDDIIKAYKMGKEVIIMEDEDFQKAMPEKVDHLEIVQFINEKEIDAVYFEKPYYLEPDKSGARAYSLLREALKKENKATLGTVVYHNKEWVALIKPLKNILVMHRLRFAEEIRDVSGLVIPEAQVKPDEIKMAAMLIGQLTAPFKPEKFKDEYSQKLLKVIEAKAQGKKTLPAMKIVHSATTEDLMAKLKASLNTKTKKAS